MADNTYEIAILLPTGCNAIGEIQIAFTLADGTTINPPNYDVSTLIARTQSELDIEALLETNIGTGTATVNLVNDEVDCFLNITITYTISDTALNYPSIFLDTSTSFAQYVRFIQTATSAPADLTICTECRQSNQQACGETYFIEAGLTSGNTYYAAITDRNNDVYIQAIIADGDGNLTIDALALEFPVGFWLAESGNKSITVYEDEEMTIVSELTVGANVYTCMILTLQYMYTTTSGLIPDFAFYVSDTLDFYVDNSSNTYIA